MKDENCKAGAGAPANKKNRGRFQPGQSGNPNGRPKLPEDIKKARKLTQVKLERILNKYIYMDRAEFQLMAEKETGMPVLECLVVSILSRATLEGDEKRLEFLLKRLIGPVVERHELSGPNGKPIETRDVSDLTDDELDARIAESLEKQKGSE